MTNESAWPLVSAGTRFPALDVNPTKRPVLEMELPLEYQSPSSPTADVLTRTVETAPGSSKTPSRSGSLSRTNVSRAPLVSPATRFEASELKAMKRPDEEMPPAKEKPFPSAPSLASLTRKVLTEPGSSKMPSESVSRSRMNTSPVPLVSPLTRFVATDVKATYLPLREKHPAPLAKSASMSSLDTLRRTVLTVPGSSYT